jgi:hypothetical protein
MARAALRLPVCLALPLFLSLAASLGCSTLLMGEPERFVQGTWMHATDLGDGHASYLEVNFDTGRFTMDGYPPLHQTGRYRVASSAGDTLTLRLTGQSGDLPTDDRDMVLVLDPAADQLLIDGEGPFTRTEP